MRWWISSTSARVVRVVCLMRVAPALLQRAVGHPADRGHQLARGLRGVGDAADEVAARDVEVVLEQQGHRHRREGGVERAVEGLDGGDARRPPGGEDHDLVAGAQHAAGHLPGVAAVVVVLLGLRADHPLHGEARVVEVARRGDLDRLEVVQQRRSLVPGHVGRGLDDVVAVQRRDRDEGEVLHGQPAREVGELVDDLAEALLAPVHEVHLVDRDDQVGDAQQRRDERVALGLLEDPAAGVDEDDRRVGGGGAGDHVARVLLVARRVGEDELALGGGEVAVGDVDRDALLALGAQAVGEQREVERAVAVAALGGLGDLLELVLEDLLGVVEQAPDQGALAVVDRPGGGQAQQVAPALARVRRGVEVQAPAQRGSLH